MACLKGDAVSFAANIIALQLGIVFIGGLITQANRPHTSAKMVAGAECE